MKYSITDGELTIFLCGRIDAKNARDTEDGIAEVLADNPGLSAPPKFDAHELEYISSAGLRVLLKYRKAFRTDLEVMNVPARVYDIFEVTGFTELLKVRKELRNVSIGGCAEIGRGHFSTVYRLNADTIVKVFNRTPTTLERIYSDQQRAREIFIRGIPTAISFDVVKVGNHYGIVYEMIDALSVSGTLKLMPEKLPVLGRKMGALLKMLHSAHFPAGTLPDGLNSLYGAVTKLAEHGIISAGEREMLNRIIDGIPPNNTLIHCDYHPNNILVHGDELVLIDVGEASLGHPALDFGSSYFLMFSLSKLLNVPAEKIAELVGIGGSMISELWSVMLAEYFGTADAEELRKYNALIEEYSMLRGIFVGTRHIGDENFDAVYKPLLRKSIEYFSEHGEQRLEEVILP